MHVLLVTRDFDLQTDLTKAFAAIPGTNVSTARRRSVGYGFAESYLCDVVAIDETINESLVKTAALFRKLKSKVAPETHVVGISDTPETRAALFTAGADAVMEREESKEVMPALTRALVRRAHGYASNRITINAEHAIELDLREKKMFVMGQDARLTTHEYAFLEALAMQDQIEGCYERLVDRIYGSSDGPEDPCNIFQIMLNRINKKVDVLSAGAAGFVKRYPRLGYHFA